jgi:hypothetical protein
MSPVLMVLLVGASIHTEFWEPIIDHPKKLWAVALLIGILGLIFVYPSAQELQERLDRPKSRKYEE